jgi:hypothetical protein
VAWPKYESSGVCLKGRDVDVLDTRTVKVAYGRTTEIGFVRLADIPASYSGGTWFKSRPRNPVILTEECFAFIN